MHDIDRALFELAQEGEGEGEGESYETGEFELAAELLEVSSEQELEQFLGDLLSKAAGVGRAFLASDAGRAVTGVVRNAARTALPQLGQAIGNAVAPGIGGALGRKAGAWAGGALGLELEGLSQEDRELEAARAVVRFAQTAAQHAAQAPLSMPPTDAAVRAAIRSAQQHLPGLVPVIQQLARTVRRQRRQLAVAATAPTAREYEGEGEYGEYEGEYQGEGEFGEYEGEGEYENELEGELAQELLEISSEQELEQFIGKLVSSVGKGIGSFARSGIGKAVGGVLRNVAKTALPMVGSAVGSFLLPGVGTALGGQLGSMAGKLLEVGEYETMSRPEAEYEMARRFVRFGRATTRYALRTPRNVPPRVAARSAAVTAARRYAPGLLRPPGGSRRPSAWRGRRDSRMTGYQRPYRQYRPQRPERARRTPWQWGGVWDGRPAGIWGDAEPADRDDDSWNDPFGADGNDGDDPSGFGFE